MFEEEEKLSGKHVRVNFSRGKMSHARRLPPVRRSVRAFDAHQLDPSCAAPLRPVPNGWAAAAVQLVLRLSLFIRPTAAVRSPAFSKL